MIHCSEEREHRFEKFHKGNTELHVKDDCMVEETSMDPNFKIMPTTASLKNATYTKEYEEPQILQVLLQLDNISMTDNLKHIHMNKELDEQLRLRTETLLNNTINSKNKIKHLDTQVVLSNWHSVINSSWYLLILMLAVIIN